MKKILLICLSTFLYIQFVYAQTTITGRITNKKDKTPIEGASISVKGFKMPSVITDENGSYTINIPEGAKTIEVSYSGMKTITMKIGKKKKINFKMVTDLNNNSDNNINTKGSNKQMKK